MYVYIYMYKINYNYNIYSEIIDCISKVCHPVQYELMKLHGIYVGDA